MILMIAGRCYKDPKGVGVGREMLVVAVGRHWWLLIVSAGTFYNVIGYYRLLLEDSMMLVMVGRGRSYDVDGWYRKVV